MGVILAGLTGLGGRGRPSPQQGRLVGRGWRARDPVGGWDALADPLTGTPPADQFDQNDLLSQQRDGYGTHEDVGVRHDRQGLPLRLACAALWIAHASMKGSRAVNSAMMGQLPSSNAVPPTRA